MRSTVDHMLYTEETKQDFEPPRCPECDAKGEVTWLPMTVSWERGVQFYVPGMIRCPNCH